jgi:hypothetical protein
MAFQSDKTQDIVIKSRQNSQLVVSIKELFLRIFLRKFCESALHF